MKHKYGYEWGGDASDATIELACYRLGGSKEHDKAWHLKRAIKELYPEPVYMWSRWSDLLVEAWCAEDWVTVWGASSTGKSTTLGLLSLVHWLSAPWCTTMTVCSTTKDALRKRIWNEILKFYMRTPSAPGRYYPGRTAIIYPQVAEAGLIENKEYGEESVEIKESRNGIFGVAVQRGSVEESFSNLIGVHNTYNALLLDEMQAVREAAVEAVSNLQGGKEFKFCGMGNPSSRLDLLGKYSMPKSGNWNDINTEMETWETERGICVFLDGRKSPAIVEEDGEKRYPFLLKEKDIETRKKWFGENSHRYWSQTIGFIPPDDLDRTVFTETYILHNGMNASALWDGRFEVVAGVDWSFTEGGDRCIVQPAKVGRVNGVMSLEFMDYIELSIDVSEVEPSSFITARKVMTECNRLGVSPVNVGCDASGTQGPQTDILEQLWGKGVLRVSFGGKASERIIPGHNLPASQVYANRMTELWYQIYNLGRTKQIYGVNSALSSELISRKLIDDKQRSRPLLQLEPKSLMRLRTGESPDIADAAAIAVEAAMTRLGLSPEGLNIEGGGVGDYMRFAQEVNYKEEEGYTVSMEEAYA